MLVETNKQNGDEHGRIKSILTVVALLLMFLSIGVNARVTVRMVTNVVYSSGGEVIGAYKQETRDSWAEYTREGNFSF